ncbi:MAG: TetR/AcrR family transcriptional regulator [Ignavibacteria bacterium]|nr:TetR/AcrR family transcriptional regulator [Ignavibacteria bacterium]
MKDSEKKDTRNKIFIAAAELFSRDGFYKVSVREICEHANVTKPVLYYYFKDKETLLLELVKETDRIGEELKNEYFQCGTSFSEKIFMIAEIYKTFVKTYPYLLKFNAFAQFMNMPEEVRNHKTNMSKRGMEELSVLFKNAQKDGFLNEENNIDMLIRSFIGPIILLLSQFMLEGNLESFSEDIEKFVKFWLHTYEKKIKEI